MEKQIIILEQPTEWGGKGQRVPPGLIGKVDKTKYDVSADGKWMKPKESPIIPPKPNPIDDVWDTITDSKLVQKLESGIGDFYNKIKAGVPSIVQDGSKWVYKKGDDLKQWWEKYQKEHGDSPIKTDDTTSKIYKTKGDPYQYKLINCVWFTKSLIKKNRVKFIPDWISLENNQNANDILDGRFPEAKKNCVPSKIDGTGTGGTGTGDTGTTETETTLPVNLPTWATCIGQSIKSVIVTIDDNNNQIIMVRFGKDTGYFWDDNTFMFSYSNGIKVAGNWSCDGSELFITTTDGEQWSNDTQWIVRPSSSINPSVNYQTTGVDATTVMTNDASEPEVKTLQKSSSEPKKSDKSSTLQPQPPTPLQKPSEPIEKPDVDDEKSDLIDKYGKQNESISLEDVVNNINSLITEQTQLVVVAPAQELDILYNNAVLKNIGSVETLCKAQNGTSKPVNINGRIYFAGRRGKLTPALGGGEGYIVYDGKILRNTGGCNYTYVVKNGNIVTMDGIESTELQLPFINILSRFGIDGADYNTDPYYFIDTITSKFQTLIDRGARSMIFKSWSDLLKQYYKYGPQEKWLKITDPKSLTNPPQDEMNKYQPMTADNLGIKYLDKQIVIYQPLGRGTTSNFKGATYNSGECRTDLISYVSAAFEFNQNGSVDRNVGSAPVRNNIRACYRAGKYQGFVIKPEDIKVEFIDKDNPFKGMRGFGNDLDIKEIQTLLGGETHKLPKVGPSGKNPFLPFVVDSRQDMNESKLTGLIKENLLEISKQKNQSLLIEKRIVQTRTKLISENRILKFKQPREKFFSEIIGEAMYFNKQGFDKQIIKEEFWDSMKGLFGEHGSSAIFSTFKEYMGKHLVEKLTSINPNGWMGQNIKKAINTIHIEDIDKIVDCDFITKKVSSSISEAIINKISQGQDIEGGGIQSIVKGGLDKSIDRTELNKNIHNGISKLICPVLGDVSKKLKEKGEEMKLKAVKP